MYTTARGLPTLFAMLSPDRQQELCHANSRFFRSTTNPSPGDTSSTNRDVSSQAKYISSNTWPRSSRGRKLKKGAARPFIHGVEIRLLRDPHPLAGELGLFAAKTFDEFDILGEYCGEVYEGDGGSEYATYLEDWRERYALGVDATREGNECRFINHFKGIADEANVVMKIAYVEELPRVMVVCMRDIEVGEEFLLNYSDDFVEAYCS